MYTLSGSVEIGRSSLHRGYCSPLRGQRHMRHRHLDTARRLQLLLYDLRSSFFLSCRRLNPPPIPSAARSPARECEASRRRPALQGGSGPAPVRRVPPRRRDQLRPPGVPPVVEDGRAPGAGQDAYGAERRDVQARGARSHHGQHARGIQQRVRRPDGPPRERRVRQRDGEPEGALRRHRPRRRWGCPLEPVDPSNL